MDYRWRFWGKEKMLFSLILLVVYFLLVGFYTDFVSKIFHPIVHPDAYGYPESDFNYLRFLFSTFIVVCTSLFLGKIDNAYSLLYFFYYSLVILPFYALVPNDANIPVYVIATMTIISLMYAYSNMVFESLVRPVVESGAGGALGFLYVYFLLSLIVAFLLTDFIINSKVEGVLDVYEQRTLYKDSIVGLKGKMIDIGIGWIVYGFGPVVIYHGIKHRNWILLLFPIAMSFLIFLSTGLKAVLVVPFVVIFGYTYISLFRSISVAFSMAVLLLILLSILTFYAFDNYSLISMVLRRLMFLHAQLHVFYIEFINGDGFLYWGGSYLKNFVAYPYDMALPYVIGLNYFGEARVHANAGYLVDSYVNFGFLAVFLAVIFLMSIFYVFHSRVHLRREMLVVFCPVSITLTDSSLVSVLVYQLFPLLAVLYFYCRKF